MAVIIAYIEGNEYKRFSREKADFNKDGYIDHADAEGVANEIIISDSPSPLYKYNTPYAVGELYGNDFELALGEDGVIPLNLMSYSGEGYSALQFDVRVPDGVFVDDIVPGDVLAGHKFVYEMLDMNTYRVVIYSDNNTTFNNSDDVVVNIKASAMSVVEEDARSIDVFNAYAVNNNNDEVRFDDVSIAFGQSTCISGLYATALIKGGDCITVTALEEQEIIVYSVDGRLLRRQHVAEGTTRIELPAGMYVVNGTKVLVY